MAGWNVGVGVDEMCVLRRLKKVCSPAASVVAAAGSSSSSSCSWSRRAKRRAAVWQWARPGEAGWCGVVGCNAMYQKDQGPGTRDAVGMYVCVVCR
jgi:hypothetical protein